MIERGSWQRPKLDRELHVCKVCKIIEDELHFILICPLYSTLRSHYIDKKYWQNPSLTKLVEIFNSNKKDLYGLFHFIRKAEELYNQLFLENI